MIPDRVHLVGSIGLDTVDDVFRTAGRLLGRRLKLLPDGEPGSRRLWVSFQYPLLRSMPFLRPDPSGALRKTSGFPLLCLADGVTPGEIRFGELGYAREARASYEDFCTARQRGDIAPAVRFQVCLPTPMGVTYAFCTAPDVVAIDAAYEAAMIREVEAICRAIPHHDLCLQWDVCHEMIIWDGQPQDQFPLVNATPDDIVARVVRICAGVPPDVELGFHLCYGDFGARHLIEPLDAGKMVEVANAFAAHVGRPIAYIHMPVPRGRTDADYFKPRTGLKLGDETELYLGVIHAVDGLEGTRRRIDAASRYVTSFGIATECGIARARKPDLVDQLLRLHAQLAREP